LGALVADDHDLRHAMLAVMSTAYVADKAMVWVSPTFPQASIGPFLRGCFGTGLAAARD
jgi:hypothetical protein